MALVGLRLTLLLAVLVQYTPLQYCAVERAVLGASCHEQGVHAVFGDPHAGDRPCGYPGGGRHECVCERPKVDARYAPRELTPSLDPSHLPAAVAVVPLFVAAADVPLLPDPDPHPRAPLALHLPLLI